MTFDLFTARSSLLPCAFVWEKTFKNLILQNRGFLMAESLHILLGTFACLQWLCHSGERTVASGPLVSRSEIVQIRYLVGATPSRLFHWSFGNCAYFAYMVFRLSYHYLFSTFCTFSTHFIFRYDTLMWVACECNSSYSFIPNFLKLCWCFYHSLKMCICFWGYPPIIIPRHMKYAEGVYSFYLFH